LAAVIAFLVTGLAPRHDLSFVQNAALDVVVGGVVLLAFAGFGLAFQYVRTKNLLFTIILGSSLVLGGIAAGVHWK
jgi:hypothetical protein